MRLCCKDTKNQGDNQKTNQIIQTKIIDSQKEKIFDEFDEILFLLMIETKRTYYEWAHKHAQNCVRVSKWLIINILTIYYHCTNP